jgi:uncharacterized protein (TIGR02598 family)
MKHSFSPQLPRTAGFSLAEVTMAIGVISVSLLTMLGMMPTGLNSFKDATDSTIGAQIAQQVAADTRLTPYPDLPKLLNVTMAYDEAGSRQLVVDARTRYKAKLVKVGTVYPGADSVDLKDSVTTVALEITPVSGQTQKYVLHVPNSDS